jgi:hypothetical protein
VPLVKPHNHAKTSSACSNYFKGHHQPFTHFTQLMMAQHATLTSAPPQMASHLHAFSDENSRTQTGSCDYRHPSLICSNSLTQRRKRLIYIPHSAHCTDLCFQQLWQFPCYSTTAHCNTHNTAIPGMPKPLMYLSTVVHNVASTNTTHAKYTQTVLQFEAVSRTMPC